MKNSKRILTWLLIIIVLTSGIQATLFAARSDCALQIKSENEAKVQDASRKGIVQNIEKTDINELEEKGSSIELQNEVTRAGASGVCGENLKWVLSNDGVLTISGEGDMYDYEFDWQSYESSAPWFSRLSTIKKVVLEEGVTSIGNYAFCPNYQTYITDIELGKDVTRIGKFAFYFCLSLERITVEGNLTDVGDDAFSASEHLKEIHIPDLSMWCTSDFGTAPFGLNDYVDTFLYIDGVKVTDPVIPNDVERIGRSAFSGISGITKVTMHDNIKSIGDYAFSGCDLSEIVLPDSVESIGKKAFGECKFSEIILPDSIEFIGEQAFWECENLASITLPEGITSIEAYTFSGCRRLGNIKIPENVENIKSAAFLECESLSSVTIPSKVKCIESRTFSGCTKLTNVSIPDGVSSIGDEAFKSTDLSEIRIPNTVTGIGENAFSECDNLKEVEVPDSVESMGANVFKGCDNLRKVVLSDNLESINENAFENCGSIVNMIIPEKVISIGNSAFKNCDKLQSITLHEGIESIGDNAFQNCSDLKEIILPTGITVINSNTFNGCGGLEAIVIPSGVTTINTCAFNACGNLSTVTFSGDAPEIAGDAFKTVKATCYYPSDNATYTKEILTQDFGGDLLWQIEGEDPEYSSSCGENVTWQLAEDGTLIISGEGKMYDYSVEELNYAPWYEIRSSVSTVEIGDGVTYIGNDAFYSCDMIKSIVMADSVVKIGENAFYRCKAQTIDFSENLTEIGMSAFWGCQFENLILPEKLSKVGEGVFNSNTRLISVVLPDSMTYIPEKMFYNCQVLQEVSFPERITYIGNDAFRACYDLKSIVLPEGLISIGEAAFAECGEYLWGDGGTAFKSVTLPESILEIGNLAFWGCEHLSEINLPNGLQKIGERAFYGCDLLKNLEIPDSVTEIGSGALSHCGIESVHLPDNLTILSDGLFLNSDSLKNVNMPKKLLKIEKGALSSCDRLKEIRFECSAPIIDEKAFGSVGSGKTKLTAYYPGEYASWAPDKLQNYGGEITWIPLEMDLPPEGGGDGGGSGEEGNPGGAGDKIDINVENGAANAGAVCTKPEGGWKTGTNTFYVSCDAACMVAVSYDGGKTYTRLPAAEASEGYNFTIENMTQDTIISVEVAGDVNGDGIFSNADITKMRAAYAGKVTLNALQTIRCDVNNDGQFTNADITKLQAVYAGKAELSW